MRRGWALAVWWLCCSAGARAQEFETDARSAGCGGSWVLGRLEDSPGRQAGRDFELSIDASLPWAGLGMSGGAIRVERDTARWRASGCLSQLRTPVGNETALRIAGAAAWHAWSAGASLQLRLLDLDETAHQWTPILKFGAGMAPGVRTVFCVVLQVAPPRAAEDRGALGFAVELVDGVQVLAQVVHTTGIGSEVRMGVECGAGTVRWLGGFDPNTQALSFGLVWQDRRQGIAWGARTHPALGWSHWWTYTRGTAALGS
jgi:hypothetical protein